MLQRRQILIVNSSPYINISTWHLLLPESLFEIIGPVDQPDQTIDLPAGSTPDIILIDLSYGPSGALAAVQSWRTAYPDAPIIALTTRNDPDYNQFIQAAGVTTCLEKSEIATFLWPTLDRLAPVRLPAFNNWLGQLKQITNRLFDPGLKTDIVRYIIYTGFGLVGGAMGATLAMGLAIIIQSILPPTVTFSPGIIPLIGLTILMSLIVSWMLRHLTHLFLPQLASSLNGQALQIILVSSSATGILQVIYFSRGWGLY